MSDFLSDSPPIGQLSGPVAAYEGDSSMKALLELRDAVAKGQYQSLVLANPPATASTATAARIRLLGSELEVASATGNHRPIHPKKFLNAQDYGFLPSADAAENLTALHAALAAAQVASAAIFIPAGLYRVDLGPLAVGGVTIDKSTTIVGEGKGKTVLKCGHDVTVPSALFRIRPGVDFECQDISIMGPDVIRGVVYGTGADSPDCYGIYHEGNNRGQTSGIALRNVLMRKWNTAVYAFHKADVGDTVTGCVLNLRDCELTSRKWPLRIFGGNRPVAELNAFNCTFGLDEDEYFIGAQGEYAPLYIRGEVAHELVNCRFTFSNKYGIYCDHADNRAVVARKAAIVDCHFDREVVDPVPKAPHPFFPATWGTGTGINCGMQNNTTARQLLVLGGRFHSTIGISPSVAPTIIIGATFYGYRGGAGVDNNDGYLGPVTVMGCSFYDPLGADGFAHSIRREIAGVVNPFPTHDSTWRIVGNDFYGVNDTGANIKIDGADAAGSHIAIIGNNFYAERCSANIYVNGGSVDVRRNRWYRRGAGGGTVGLIAQAVNEPTTLNFDDNEAHVSGVYPMFLDAVEHPLVVRGGRNRAFSSGEGFYLEPSATNITGHLRLPEAAGTASFGAGKITIGTDGDTFRHTAAAKPSYSDIWVANPVSGAHNARLYHGARLELVAETVFSLTHGTGAANARILLRGAADKTIAAGSTIVLSFDATLAAWTEVAACLPRRTTTT